MLMAFESCRALKQPPTPVIAKPTKKMRNAVPIAAPAMCPVKMAKKETGNAIAQMRNPTG